MIMLTIIMSIFYTVNYRKCVKFLTIKRAIIILSVSVVVLLIKRKARVGRRGEGRGGKGREKKFKISVWKGGYSKLSFV